MISDGSQSAAGCAPAFVAAMAFGGVPDGELRPNGAGKSPRLLAGFLLTRAAAHVAGLAGTSLLMEVCKGKALLRPQGLASMAAGAWFHLPETVSN